MDCDTGWKTCVNQALRGPRGESHYVSGKVGGVKELLTRLGFVFAHHSLANLLIINITMLTGLSLFTRLNKLTIILMVSIWFLVRNHN